MYLKRLVLRGFKSFASATSLNLEPGITCIVGPNGSGKSNLVDAMTWVMGEQGAKSLRGASMEDVVFAGTSSRPPLGRAEVQLTIDNSDGALPIDYTEVTISRTKFRNGESEYAINGTSCRLLDIRELLSDSGIGRQMHVVVGQGHLDQILQATPEVRRGFIEEAAGVLKHRERKERALRKLDSTQANLDRLTDLVVEIGRQLKPLGRQAEVAKRASVVQADLRDAKARLLADDIAQAHALLGVRTVDEAGVQAKRRQIETDLDAARAEEDAVRTQSAQIESAHRSVQQTWFSLSETAERTRSVVTLANERVRNAESQPVAMPNPARDPATLLAQAAQIAASETDLRHDIAGRTAELDQASAVRTGIEAQQAEAEQQFETLARARSDRREGLARLSGEIASMRKRVDSAVVRLSQAAEASQAADAKSDSALREFQAAQAGLPDLEAGEQDLDAAYGEAALAVDQARTVVESLRSEAQRLTQAKAGLAARVEALQLAQHADADAAAWIVEESPGAGVLGPVLSLIQVDPGYEQAAAAALGPVAEAVAVTDLGASLRAVAALKDSERGRAGFVVADARGPAPEPVALPAGATSLTSVLHGDAAVIAALARIVGPVAVIDVADEAPSLLRDQPGVRVVTRDGDVLSPWWVVGGSAMGQSAVHIAAALSEAEAQLSATAADVSHLEADLARAQDSCTRAETRLAHAVAALNESDAAQAAAAESLSRLNQASLLAQADADRLAEQVRRAEQELDRDRQGLAALEERLALVEGSEAVDPPDPGAKDALADQARQARSAEMEARLALRTLEERVRSLAGQAESLRQAAESERSARAEADRRREVLSRQAGVARTVAQAGQWLLNRTQASLSLADDARSRYESDRVQADLAANELLTRVRTLSAGLETLIDSAHREELARAQQTMRIESLTERALAEVGLDAAALLAEFGPDRLVPTGGLDDSGEPQLKPYVREEQLKRLRTAERDLAILGKVNPLALEEFDAMQERHAFLAGQLEDLKKTRHDLNSIVDEVDARVQAVFAEAYGDVAREFSSTFARLFPGGEGHLLLTEPDQWLTTGVDIEARLAGKNVKRLSLLSGGERSLVAVCFLIALFQARPSPFYILDEVEAALDDTNLGRLLEIYEELRVSSQLLIITHQKRTMEIADTLYGVTMGTDGTSTVVSQRLREDS